VKTIRATLLATIAAIGCGGQSGGADGQQSVAQETACQYPANVDSDDGAMSGCHAGPPGRICIVSNGASINAEDGGVTGGTESCRSLCGATDYEMTCTSGGVSDPAASLGCQVIPDPTPFGEVFYCCPCAN